MRLQEQAQQPGETGGQNTSPESSNSGDRDLVYIHDTPESDINSIQTIESQLAGASSNVTFQVNNDRLLDMFYESFWDGFPFVLPHHFLKQRKARENHSIDNLLLVMQWIGSVYAPWTPSEPYYEAAHRALVSPSLPRDPWTVQALMLMAIGEHHWDLRTEARKTLDQTLSLAIELQMNTKSFARAYGESDAVLEESWRRTYYFLILTDRYFAVVVNSPFTTLMEIPNLVDLPCDDEFYESGVSLHLMIGNCTMIDDMHSKYRLRRPGKTMR
jgi:hypothetical protein